MIRSRKDEGTTPTVLTATTSMVALHNHDPVSSSTLGTANTNVAPTASPAAFRYQQQRTLSNTATTTTTTTKTMTIATTPTIKRTNSSIAAIASHKEEKSSINSAPSATAVSSFANTASSSVSSSLRYYHSLIQNQMYNVRKSRSKKKSKHSSDTNIWTVQMPKRMLFGTMGIFLLIPVLLFVYKETHLPKESELRKNRNHDSSSYGSNIMMKKSNRNQEYVSWMANFMGNEEAHDMEDDAVGAASVEVNETTIHQDKLDANDNNETTITGGGGLNDKDDGEIQESGETTTKGTKGINEDREADDEIENENG